MGIFTLEGINKEFTGVKKAAIAGHIRPDGDCVGSCTGFYLYLKQNMEQLGLEQVDVYLEPFGQEFNILSGVNEIKHTYDAEETYDLFISLDCSSPDRLGNAIRYFETAGRTICIDHHITNTRFADVNHVIADASSTCEVIFQLLDEKLITKEIAELLYVGIVHDTGVFKHSNTSGRTMEIAAWLIRKGINFTKLVDETFFVKSYMQLQLLGRCLMESLLVLGGRVIVSSLSRRMLDFYEAGHSDLDGIIDQLRAVRGSEVAIFLYEQEPQVYKVSLRSNGKVDVSRIASIFGGGGHIKAAGCSMPGTVQDVINNLLPHIEKQLKESSQGANEFD